MMANTFQGHFPDHNAREDGYAGTSPVGSFPANGWGLYDMAGNVWEWCADWYRPDYYAVSPRRAPPGPVDSLDPDEPGVPKRVQRGGSFLCTDEYCSRYRPGGRGKGDALTGASNVGFRCVVSRGVYRGCGNPRQGNVLRMGTRKGWDKPHPYTDRKTVVRQ